MSLRFIGIFVVVTAASIAALAQAPAAAPVLPGAPAGKSAGASATTASPSAAAGSATRNDSRQATAEMAQVAAPAAAPNPVEAAPSFATLPEAPRNHRTRNVVLASGMMFGSAFFNAYAARRGGYACLAEHYNHFAPFGGTLTPAYEFQRALTIQLPINAAVMVVSLWKKNTKWALLLPTAATAVQFGVGATQLSAGCF